METDFAEPRLPPAVWRWVLIALTALFFCSCRAPSAPQSFSSNAPSYGACPPGAYGNAVPPGAETLPPAPPPPPLPYSVTGPWKPPGIACPWPADEYLCDGGDSQTPAKVDPDWTVKGLEQEDTIGHFDTLAGQTIVQPSNRVCIYAPRFASVRSVAAVVQDNQIHSPGGVEQPIRLARHDELLRPTTGLQNLRPEGQIGRRQAGAYLTRQGDGQLSTALLPSGFDNSFLPFENVSIIRHGIFDQTEEAFLAQAVDAAITWTGDQAAQVVLNGQVASETAGVQKPQFTYTVDSDRHPKLRVIKVASTQEAAPGETVDFTIRFDNIGDEVIGNVTIIDNLTTRLEYVEGSAQSSVKADFSTQRNEAGSLVLRWEVADPMRPGDGGVVRFRCRVR